MYSLKRRQVLADRFADLDVVLDAVTHERRIARYHLHADVADLRFRGQGVVRQVAFAGEQIVQIYNLLFGDRLAAAGSMWPIR